MPLAALAIDVDQKESAESTAMSIMWKLGLQHSWGGGMVVGKGGLFLINSTLVLWTECHRSTCLVLIQ